MKLFVAAKALIVNEGKVLVLREATYDEGINVGKWDVVGGRINPEEKLLEGLKREVLEESGLEIEIGQILDVMETFPTIKGEECHIIRVFYVAKTDCRLVKLSLDHDQFEWIDPSKPEGKEYVSGTLELFEILNKLKR